MAEGRRGRGDGSITLRKDGRWMGRVTVAPGVRKAFYGHTKAEVSKAVRDALAKVERGLPQDDTRSTVAAFMREWLDAKANIRPSTRAGYTHYVNAHIIPAIGSRRLLSLRPQDIDAMLAALDVAPATKQQVRAILRSALSWGERNGRVSRNVAKLSEPPRVTREPVQPLTAEQARILVAAVEEEPDNLLGPLYVLALDTGLRQGELLGLRWTDVDLEARALRVVQARQAVKGPATFGEPKSATSRRRVTFTPITAALLERQQATQSELRTRAGRKWPATGLVFTTREGNPLHGSTVSHAFGRFLGAHELPRVRFHDLRHSSASILMGAGVPARAIADRLGHSTTRLTLDTYAHLGGEAQDRAAETMGAALQSKAAPARR